MSDSNPEQGGSFATLSLEGRDPVDVRIAGADEETMTVLLLRGAAPAPESDQRGEVHLDDLGGTGQRVSVQVAGCRGDGAAYVVTLRSGDSACLKSLSESGVSKHAAQRASFRVAPAPDEDIHVDIALAGGQHDALLVDVSASGIGLEAVDDVSLNKGDVCSLDLQLPGTGNRFKLDARVCFIGERHGHPRYGLEFVVKDTASSQRSVAHVVTYVMRRQREMLLRPSA